ncbi:hypothetical protein [Microbacterium paludicola]|uniref:hypothetical protein n=1 Tax=Microbacterium paludicola TaxID=300019 RepID=UPI000903D773|nr:hypothetical protein [Microbacterium paludicola]APF34910.1 hypothetical protein BO218_12535 [Microbacterium paludicola]
MELLKALKDFAATRKRRVLLWLLLLVAGGTVGWFIRNASDPFVLDDLFWRDFWSGPPAAGIFAVVAAGIAYFAARHGARETRRTAERSQWWDRAEWALDLARSDERVDRIIGLRALEEMKEGANETEGKLIVAVTTSVTGDVDVDNGPDPAENRLRRRFPWSTRRDA